MRALLTYAILSGLMPPRCISVHFGALRCTSVPTLGMSLFAVFLESSFVEGYFVPRTFANTVRTLW